MATPHIDEPNGWFVVIATALFGSTGFWGWMKARGRRQSASAESTAGAAKDLIDGAVDLNAEYRKQLVFVRKQCARLERSVRKLSGQVASCETKHTACEAKTERQAAELAELRRQFEAYTASTPPAAY